MILLEYPLFGGMHSMPVPVKAVATTGSLVDFGKSFRSANEYAAIAVLSALSYFPSSTSLTKQMFLSERLKG